MVADMAANMEVHTMADIEVDKVAVKVADMVANMEVDKVVEMVADEKEEEKKGHTKKKNKQGQKLVLSDALAVQSQGLRVSRSKGFKS